MNGKVLLLIAALCVPLAAAAQKEKRVEPLKPLACRQLADTFAKVGARMALRDMLQLRNCVSRILVEKGRREMGAMRGTRRGAAHPRLTPLRPPGAPGAAHPGMRAKPGALRRTVPKSHPAMPPATAPAKPGTAPAPEAPHN